MYKNKIIITLCALLVTAGSSSVSYAEVFSSEPPSEFLALKVGVKHPNADQSYPFTVQEYLSFLKKIDAQLTWTKSGEGCVLKAVVPDAMTGKKPYDSYMFLVHHGEAVITRYVQNGVDNDPFSMPVAIQPMMLAAAQVLGKVQSETGNEAQASKKVTQKNSTEKPKKKLFPSESFLSLKISRPNLEDPNILFEEGQFKTSQLYEYMQKNGPTEWVKTADATNEAWIIKSKSKSKTIEISLQQQDYYPSEIKNPDGSKGTPESVPVWEVKIMKVVIDGKTETNLDSLYAEVSNSKGRSTAGEK